MSDIIDRANDLADFDRERALANIQVKKPTMSPLFISENGINIQLCSQCEEEIPHQRLLAIPDAVLCIDCQELWEKHL